MLRMIAISAGLVGLSIAAGIGLSASHAVVSGAPAGLRLAELESPAALPGASRSETDYAPVTLAAIQPAPATAPAIAVRPAPQSLAPAGPEILHFAGWENTPGTAPLTSPRPAKRPQIAPPSRVTVTAVPRLLPLFEPLFEPIFTPSVPAMRPRVTYGAPSAEVARRPSVLPGYLIGVYR